MNSLNHLHIAKSIYKNLLQIGDFAIDATCGNGNDTLFLANCVLSENEGRVMAIDIQKMAIANTKELLEQNLAPKKRQRVELCLQSHESFSDIALKSAKLIVYNLGYLPGSSREVKTDARTTLKSLKNALPLLQKGGLLSITCYPGHEEGKEEHSKLISFFSELNLPIYTYKNHKDKTAPALYLLQK